MLAPCRNGSSSLLLRVPLAELSLFLSDCSSHARCVSSVPHMEWNWVTPETAQGLRTVWESRSRSNLNRSRLYVWHLQRASWGLEGQSSSRIFCRLHNFHRGLPVLSKFISFSELLSEVHQRHSQSLSPCSLCPVSLRGSFHQPVPLFSFQI